MKKMWNTVLSMSRPTLMLIVGVLIVTGLMLFKLSTLTPGLSEAEMQTLNSANSLGAIFDNTVNGPYKLAIYITTGISNSIFGLRFVGAMIGLITVGVFYLFVRKLMSPIVAIATTFMFAATSSLLHTARLAGPEVMLLSLLSIVALGFLLRFHKNNDLIWILAAAIIGLSLYVPGMIVFVLIASLFQFRHVRKSFEQLKPLTIIIASVLFSVLLAPMVINLIREPELWGAYLGLPSDIPSITVIATNTLNAFTSVFIYSEIDPVRHVGRQPILDVFATVLVVYGFVALVKQYKLDRFWILLGLILLGLLWVGVTDNPANIVLLLPFLYILVGVGMQKLLNLWIDIFPHNPIAKTIGYSLLLITVGLAINLHIQRYFNAWPNADETKDVFVLQIPRE